MGPRIEGRPGATMAPLDLDQLKADLIEVHGNQVRDTDVISAAMYPAVCKEFLNFKSKYGPVDKFPTRIFLTGPKVGEEFEVTIAQGKTVHIRDKTAVKEMHIHPKADKSVRGSVGAPMPGSVIDVRVKKGDRVEKGQPLVVLSAMKMEMVVQSPVSGVVLTIDVAKDMKLEGDDLLVTIEEVAK